MESTLRTVDTFPPFGLPSANVGEEDYGFASGTAVLRTDGIGPCLGIVIYSPERKYGSLAHISGFRKVPKVVRPENIVETMLSGMDNHTALVAYLAGESWTDDDVSRTVAKQLEKNGVMVMDTDLGIVPKGRSMLLYCDSGKVEVYRYQ